MPRASCLITCGYARIGGHWSASSATSRRCTCGVLTSSLREGRPLVRTWDVLNVPLTFVDVPGFFPASTRAQTASSATEPLLYAYRGHCALHPGAITRKAYGGAYGDEPAAQPTHKRVRRRSWW
jgi:acetyl-CoA carboxylase carboxyltransferase component